LPVRSVRPNRPPTHADPDVAEAANVSLALSGSGASSEDGLDLGPSWARTPGAAASGQPANGPAGQRAQASSGRPIQGIGNESEEQGEADLEDLARRLYDHISVRLRRELLLDRERSGLLTDMR
jgi:hypothetical protein